MSGNLLSGGTPKPDGWRPPELPSFRGAKELYVDFETTGLDWWSKAFRPAGIAVGVAGGQFVYLPFGHTDGNLDEAKVKAWCLSEDGLAGKRLVGANIKYDHHVWRAWTKKRWDAIGCTLGDVQSNAALLDDHRLRFNLNQLAMDELGEGEGKLDLDMSRGAHVYAAWEVEAYALQDIQLVRRILERQMPRLAAEDLLDVMKLEDACIFPTSEMEWNGSPIDEEKLDRWLIETEQKLHRSLWELARHFGKQCNPDSPKDMAALFKKRGLEPVMLWDAKIKENKISYSDEALARYAGDEAIDAARAAKKYDSLRSKYFVKFKDCLRRCGILRYQLNQLRNDDGGTVSGRYSSSAFKIGIDEIGVNAQQIMAVEKQIAKYGDEYIVRELLIAPEGEEYHATDAEQIEYRIFAHFSESPRLIQAYVDDPHINFHKWVDGLVKPYAPDLLYKQVKNVNFCRLFGGGVDKIAFMIGASVDKTREFVRAYDKGCPEVGQLMAKASKIAENRGWVRTVSGRRARFPQKSFLYRSLNRIIQGSAGDINKQKLIEVDAEREKLGITMRITNHDELTCTVPNREAAAAVDEILNQQSFPLRVPILWKGSTGANWAECK